MTSEQAAQLIDDTLDLVHQRLQDLQAQALPREQRALAEESGNGAILSMATST